MSTVIMKQQITKASPRFKARMAGVFEFLELASSLFSLIAVASGLAEIPLMLWLLVMGVNAQKWQEQASAVGERQ